jgi:hypothetical protein
MSKSSIDNFLSLFYYDLVNTHVCKNNLLRRMRTFSSLTSPYLGKRLFIDAKKFSKIVSDLLKI